MPKSPKHFAVARQWQILQMVPVRPPGVSARHLVEQLDAAGIKISKRTVERDLNELSLIFDLCNATFQSDGTQGWYFATNRIPVIGSIDHLDAMLLVLAGDVLDQMLPIEAYRSIATRIEKAREKLGAMHNTPLANWLSKVRYVAPSMTQLRPKVNPDVLLSVQQSLLTERRLIVRYHGFSQTRSNLELNPLALVLRGPVLYLVATAFNYNDIRLYGLHRMRSAQLSDAPTTVPENFSIDAYLNAGAMQFITEGSIELVAEISEQLARLLGETPIDKSQAIQQVDDKWRLSATVQDSWQLRSWILSQGPELTVLKPDSLRNIVTEQLQLALKNYGR